MPEVTEEESEARPYTRSRRGATLPLRKIVLTFEDGTEETWNFPGEPAYFRESKNRQTKPESEWDMFNVWWTSNKMVESESFKPILDARGRATGFLESLK